MYTMQDHTNFRKVVSSSIEAIVHTKLNAGNFLHKCVSTSKSGSFLPFYERTLLRLNASMSTTEFFNLGINKIQLPKKEAEKILTYELTESYRALLGFVYMYRRTPKGACSVIAGKLHINSNYLRQVLSEYVSCSSKLLNSIASLYGTTYETFVTMGECVHKSDFATLDTTIYNLKDTIDFKKNEIAVVPFTNTSNADFSDQRNMSILLGLGLNKLLQIKGIEQSLSIASMFDMSSGTFNKILNFTKFPNNVFNYTMYQSIVDGLHTTFNELFTIGLTEYNTYNPSSYLVENDRKQLVHDSIINERKKVLTTYRDIVTLLNIPSYKTILVNVSGIDFPHLSRIDSIGAIPSEKVLSKIANAFGSTYQYFLEIGNLSKELREIEIRKILKLDSPINKYYKEKQCDVVTVTKDISNVLQYVAFMYKEKSIRTWAKKANISYSCIHKIKNAGNKPSKRTIQKLAAVVGIASEDLIDMGKSITDPSIPITSDSRFDVFLIFK